MKKIGIVTYSRSNNYGARIQAYALQKIFMDRGFDAEIIDVDYPKRYFKYALGRIINISSSIKEWILKYIVIIKMIEFNHKYLNRTRHLITKSTGKMVKFINKQNYDLIVCGSDEIWSARTKEIAPPSIYYLPKDIKTKKVAFAPSANGNHNFTEEELAEIKTMLEDYELIGVRDMMTYQTISQINSLNFPIEVIFDPTIAVDFPKVNLPKSLYKNIQKKIGFIFAQPDAKFPKYIMNKLGTKYKYYSVFSYIKGTEFLAISPEQFMCVSEQFDIVLTNLFHGVIFALKNNKTVFGIDTFKKYKERKSKVQDLLERIGLNDQFFSCNNKESYKYNDLILKIEKSIENSESTNYQLNLEVARKELEQYIKRIEGILNVQRDKI